MLQAILMPHVPVYGVYFTSVSSRLKPLKQQGVADDKLRHHKGLEGRWALSGWVDAPELTQKNTFPCPEMPIPGAYAGSITASSTSRMGIPSRMG